MVKKPYIALFKNIVNYVNQIYKGFKIFPLYDELNKIIGKEKINILKINLKEKKSLF